MKYITIKRFQRDIDGVHFNIPCGIELEKKKDGVLYYEGKSIAVARSFASHQHFARNDDGKGIQRGNLSHGIIKKLGGTHRPGEDTPEWDAVEKDEIAKNYRRKDHETTWLWDDSFYQAPIDDLEHIAEIIGLKGA